SGSRPRTFRQRRLRSGGADTAPRDPGGSEPSSCISLSRRLLRPYGSARRRTRGYHATAGGYFSRDTGPQLSAKRRMPRTFPVGPTPGELEGNMNNPLGAVAPRPVPVTAA